MFENNTAAKVLAVLAGLGLLAASFLFGFGLGRGGPYATTSLDYGLLREAERRVSDSSIKAIDHRKLIQGAVRGMLSALDDQYAEYLDPETYRSFKDLTSGHFSGVGLLMKLDNGKPRVVSVLDGTPAANAGIQSADLILSVDGKPTDTLSLDQIAAKIKGLPGTEVSMTVSRGGKTLEFKLVREDIAVEAVTSKMLKGGVGLIELVTFSEGVGEKVRGAVKALTIRGAKAFVLDLRGNPGGLVEEAVNVSSVFINEGKIVSYKERGKAEVTYTARGPQETKLPLALLVDQGSASASEIVAGAVQDRGRGIIVGTQTYGKGSIQTVFPLSDGSAVKLTTASYFTPSGRSIGDKGITPDVAVADKSAQLAKAQEFLRGMLADNPARRTG